MNASFKCVHEYDCFDLQYFKRGVLKENPNIADGIGQLLGGKRHFINML